MSSTSVLIKGKPLPFPQVSDLMYEEEPDEQYPEAMGKKEFLRSFFDPFRARTAVVELTPLQAQWLLETSGGNRGWINSNLSRLQKDMESGKFTLSNDAAMFDRLNRLRNSHHRFFSQIITQTTLQYTVLRRCREEDLVNIDSGAKRNGDAQMGFIPGFRKEYGETDNNEAQIITALVTRGNYEKKFLSPTEKADGILYFKDDLRFIFNTIEASSGRKKIKGLTHSSSVAAFLRALTSCEPWEKEARKEKIKYALEYLVDGGLKVQKGEMPCQPGTGSLHALSRFYNKGGYFNRKIYLTTENMIFFYLKGEDKNNATAAGGRNNTDIELFPVADLPFLQKEGSHEDLMSVLGKNVFVSLVSWARSAESGKKYKPIEIAKELCKEKFLSVNPSVSSERVIAGRLGRAIKKFDSIDFPGGRLTPARKGKRIDNYLFQVA